MRNKLVLEVVKASLLPTGTATALELRCNRWRFTARMRAAMATDGDVLGVRGSWWSNRVSVLVQYSESYPAGNEWPDIISDLTELAAEAETA